MFYKCANTANNLGKSIFTKMAEDANEEEGVL